MCNKMIRLTLESVTTDKIAEEGRRDLATRSSARTLRQILHTLLWLDCNGPYADYCSTSQPQRSSRVAAPTPQLHLYIELLKINGHLKIKITSFLTFTVFRVNVDQAKSF